MKSTGIIRKIDDLGRVVIPKEIRRNLEWDEKQTLEISVEGENVIVCASNKLAERKEAVSVLKELVGEQKDPELLEKLKRVLHCFREDGTHELSQNL